jgi:hypothetical protein
MLDIDTPNTLFAVMPNRARFSRSRGVLFSSSYESTAWTSSLSEPLALLALLRFFGGT